MWTTRTKLSISLIFGALAILSSSCNLRLARIGAELTESSTGTGSSVSVVLANTPSVSATDTSLNVTVTGTDITHYKYAVGDSSLDCSVPGNYSSEVVVSTPITDLLSGAGGKKLCVVGKSSSGAWQDFSSPTVHAWNKYLSVTVEKVYPTNSDWNQYVKDDDLTTDEYSQDDVACDGTESGAYTCIHGGEKRKVALAGETSCSGLTLTEALGAFDWECKVKAGTATFFTKALKSSKGLKDLVDAAAWKNNSVQVHRGSDLIAQSTSATWGWANAIAALPDNSSGVSIQLDGVDDDGAGPDEVYAAGTVFTLASSRASAGYVLALDGASIVTLGSAELSFNGTVTTNCNGGNCLITSDGPDRLWFEGRFDGYHASLTVNHLIRPWNSHLVTIKSSTLKNALEGVYYQRWGRLSSVRDVLLTGNGFFAPGEWSRTTNIQAYTAGGITPGIHGSIHNCRITNTPGNALVANGGSTIQQCVLSNNTLDALKLDELNSTVVGIVVHNTNRHGFTFRSSGESRATLTHFVSANNLFPFNIREDGDYMTAVNGVVLNESIALNGNGNHLANIVFNGNLETYATTVDNKVSNHLLLQSGAQCIIDAGGTNPGLVNGTCGAQGASTHTAHLGIDATGSMQFKVSSNDATNTSDSSGTATYSTGLDWLGFDSLWRGWGVDGALPFPDSSNVAYCSAGGNTACVIWDFTVKAADTVLRNRTGAAISAAFNEPFVAGSACPTAVHGNRAIEDSQQRTYYFGINGVEDNAAAGGDDDGVCESGEKCKNRFLLNAVEIYGDRSGDDDGLCESNEACIYSPNFGAYQGSGDYLSGGTCTFQDGTVTGVSMYAYPTNGT